MLKNSHAQITILQIPGSRVILKQVYQFLRNHFSKINFTIFLYIYVKHLYFESENRCFGDLFTSRDNSGYVQFSLYLVFSGLFVRKVNKFTKLPTHRTQFMYQIHVYCLFSTRIKLDGQCLSKNVFINGEKLLASSHVRETQTMSRDQIYLF